MKIIFHDNKKYMLKWVYIMSALFVAGVVLGAVYISLLPEQSSHSVERYLGSYFAEISSGGKYQKILKSSLDKNIKIFAVLFFSSFIRPGFIVSGAVNVINGFFAGFTSASFIKFYGLRGLLLSAGFAPASFIFIPVLIFYSSTSLIGSKNRYKSDRKNLSAFFVLSICCLTIFCVSAIFDAFVTTTFMKFLSSVLSVK